MRSHPSIADITLAGSITEETARSLCKRIRSAWAYYHFGEVILHISSPGGDLVGMERILREIEDCQREGVLVRTIAEGPVASAAAVIASAGSPGMREATPDARLLYHEPRYWGGSDTQHTAGHLTALLSTLSESTERMLANLLSRAQSQGDGSDPVLESHELPDALRDTLRYELQDGRDPTEPLPLRAVYTRLLHLDLWLTPKDACGLRLLDRCQRESRMLRLAGLDSPSQQSRSTATRIAGRRA